MKKTISLITLLVLMLTLIPGAVLAQEEVVCESEVTVQADDWLSNLSDKFFGNVLAYPVIVDATNAKAVTDSAFAIIENADIIELGWKLCIPNVEVAQAMLNENVFTAVAGNEASSTLVIGLTEDTVSLDPARAYEIHSSTVHRAMYETLVTFPPDRVDEIIPNLAESWTISDDGMVYTFILKEGQKFSTGRSVTAQDVAFSINRMRHIKGNPSFLASTIASIEAVDDMTVVITLSEPDPSLLAKLVYTAFGVMDSEEAKAHGAVDSEDAATVDTAEAWLNNNSAGSSPYVLDKWEPKVELILKRNPEYVGQPAAFSRVIFRTMSDAAAQKLALEAGDLDIALDITPDQVPSLKSNADLVVYEGQGDTVYFLLMNMDPAIGGAMSQDLVQDAVRLGVDYEGIRLLTGGSAVTPVNIMPAHWSFALDPSQGITRDVEAAKAKLAEAGFADGLTIDLEYPDFTYYGVSIGTLAQKVQADLAEIGITAQLKPADIQVALESYRTGQAGFALWLWNPDFIDPIDRVAFMPGGKVGLRANWPEDKASADLVALVQQAKVATDLAGREAAFTGVQNIMLDESPFAFLMQNGTQVAYRASLKGFAFNNQWRVHPYTMSK